MLLTEIQIDEALRNLPQWKQVEQSISATFVFKDFPAAIGFVNRVAELAQQANHHPDIAIRWNKVLLTLTTHSAEGLTALDFELASQVSAMVGSEDGL